MRALDTNIIVRFLVKDDPARYAIAEKLLSSRSSARRQELLVPDTVVLECMWVLRSKYKMTPEQIVAALRGVFGLPSVYLRNPEQIARALDLYEGGMDDADAMHLALNEHCEQLLTFDAPFIKHAKGRSPCRVVGPT